ncbi:class E sortase [Sinomonas halotolerans]|uniref:Class E sortase n=1 Tax=Sinomonas halotolerans TaxID=1644133 RepID=A0ABU9X289_9MICC
MQVLGELLITLGVVLGLFIVWQLWWTNVEADIRQDQAVREFVQEFEPPAATARPSAPAQKAAPPVLEAPAHGGVIGVLYIPRFGEDYARPVLEGSGRDVLDTLGLGHYPSTSMPGAKGNFALAGHRQTHGAVLDNIDKLVPGDRIYLQTKEGFYTYVFRDSRIVLPHEVDVLLPVPQKPGVKPTESLLTLTTCHPRYGNTERFIAYSVLKSWQPASEGAPPEIAARVAAALKGS